MATACGPPSCSSEPYLVCDIVAGKEWAATYLLALADTTLVLCGGWQGTCRIMNCYKTPPKVCFSNGTALAITRCLSHIIHAAMPEPGRLPSSDLDT
jgi:hypothetical protein